MNVRRRRKKNQYMLQPYSFHVITDILISLEGNDSGARPSRTERISSIVSQSLSFDGEGTNDMIDDELEGNKKLRKLTWPGEVDFKV